MEQVTQALKSRTVQFAIALAILSVLQGFILQLPVPTWAQAVIGCVVAIMVTILRIITTQPITSK